MYFTIGQVSKETGLSVYTLRYYEKEGILPRLKRNKSGLRIYGQEEINWLKMITCLRETGMTIKEMKEYARLTFQGDDTISEREQLLKKQKTRLNLKIEQLEIYMSMINHKLDIYSEKQKGLGTKGNIDN